MDQQIVVIGTGDANCRRIRDVLRRRFRRVIIRPNESAAADVAKEGILVVAEPIGSNAGSAEATRTLEERIRRAEFLFEATRILTSSDPLPEALSNALGRSRDVLGDTAFLILMDAGKPRLQCAASRNPEQLVQSLMSIINARPQGLEAQLQELLRKAESLFVANVAEIEHPDGITHLAEQLHFKSIVATPIKKDDKAFGVFVSASSGPDHLTEAHIGLSQEFSGAIAAALEKAEVLTQLEQQANTDALTGLYNARFFADVLAREVARVERHQVPLSLVLIDIDNFKRLNDANGHVAGNAALKSLARILLQAVRMTDFVFRCGGDEFSVVLPGTDLQGALRAGEHIRSRVEAAEFLPGMILKGAITVSVGVAQYESGHGSETLMNRADQALYRAKELLKNNVQAYAAGGPAQQAG